MKPGQADNFGKYKTNSGNGHLVFSIFKKKQENNGVGDISSIPKALSINEISPTPLFFCFFLNIENTRCPFSEFVLFCIVDDAR